MRAFISRNKVHLVAGASICTASVLNHWWKKARNAEQNGNVVFAHENPQEGAAKSSDANATSSAYAGFQGTPTEIRQDLIDSVPQLTKRKTDPKYIQLPPPIEELTLKNVHVFFRHGARLPLRPSPMQQVTWEKDLFLSGVPFTMINYNLKYLDGTPCNELGRVEKIYRQQVFDGGCFGGQLTNLGQDQLYQVGLECRRRYIEEQQLIPDVYKKEFVYAQSTNIMRTIESTRCVIAGLFGAQSFEESGAVADIHVSRDSEETLFPNMTICLVLREMAKRGRSAISKMTGERKFRKQCMDKLGITSSQDSTRLLFALRDDVICRLAHGQPVQENLVDLVPQILNFGQQVATLTTFGTKQDRQKYLLVAVGPIIHMMLNNMDNVYHNKNNVAKINLYGVHDTTIIPLLMSMQAYDDTWPDFGATIKFELYEDCLGDHWVRILYCDKEIKLPNCESAVCRYEQFRNEFSHLDISLNQYKSICGGEGVERSLIGRLFGYGDKQRQLPEDDSRTIPASM